jgi:nitrite reductase/ring-hydroxylating ferredoxin subunit
MRTAVLVGEDDTMMQRLRKLDAEFDLRWVAAHHAESADVVVLDLATPGAIEEVSSARKRWPSALVAGYLAVPDPHLWVSGQRAGCDLVANRGALVARLRQQLASPARRTFPVLDEGDLAGRLGLVARIDTTPVGPIAIYQIDGNVHVIGDRCPHAGALLSEGELENRQLTCPRHGSQFDVCTGERTRGPADTDIETYPVVIGGGQVSIVLG